MAQDDKQCSDKYRGTGEYSLIFAELVSAARHRGTVTYQELAETIGLPTTGNHMGKEVGAVLGEISEDEHRLGKPMLSAIAVAVDGLPGDGFFELAARLGKFNGPAQRKQFWESEKAEVYRVWQRRF